MAQNGFLVPPWYVSEKPDDTIMTACTILWGCSLCCAVFTGAKATKQSWLAFRRGRFLSTYPIMVWAEWISSVAISIICWLFLNGYIPPSFWTFFCILCLWVVQVQCILQIIVNRVSLIMPNRARARQLKLGIFIIIAVINLSVYCIWIPARLQINATYIHVNDIWDRLEKVLFAIVDAGLNFYFIYQVRIQLIGAGLTKYYPLFRFNIAMVCISLALDIVLVGSMSIGNGVIYIQIHPLVYLVKLHIELNMAELISIIVKASNPLNTNKALSMTGTGTGTGTGPHPSTAGNIATAQGSGRNSAILLATGDQPLDIRQGSLPDSAIELQKTGHRDMMRQIPSERMDSTAHESETSSLKELYKKHSVN